MGHLIGNVQFFPFPGTPAQEAKTESDVTAFLMQYDQGIAPAAYRGLFFNLNNVGAATTELTND